MEHSKHPVRRCTVYTRKSFEEGLVSVPELNVG
jgi:hypothetical protein